MMRSDGNALLGVILYSSLLIYGKEGYTMSTVAQINVKLSRDLKASGDDSLRELGISPSELVRKVWHAIALRGESRKRVIDALDNAPEGSIGAEASPAIARAQAVARGACIFVDAGKRMGLDPSLLPTLTDDELEEALLEEHVHKGWA